MITIGRRVSLGGLAAVLAAGLVALPAGAAHADPVVISDGMPDQVAADRASTDPDSGQQAGWGDLAGGVWARPYVRSLTVINGGTATPVVTNGLPAATTGPVGQVATVVAPVNLCRIGQVPAPGLCYATPNRVALTVGYRTSTGLGYNFADPSVPVTPTVNAATVIDLTVALNTLGRSLRWSWVNGDLLYWQTSNLGQDYATVHVRFRPGTAPYLAHWPDGSGCTATPIFNCAIASADAEVLTASMLFSLDNTLDPALTGAVFATQNAISGYLAPGGTPDAPTLDIQAGSTHRRSDGSLQRGTVQAFIPAAALLNLYGVLPGDAGTAFTTTRTGDPGTNDAPTYTPWTAGVNGSDGLLITVTGITFSVPRYRVAGRVRGIGAQARVVRKTTTVRASVSGCTRKSECLVTVYDLGRGSARFVAGRTPVLVNQRLRSGALALSTSSSKLRAGDRYLLVVRARTGGGLLASTLGTVR